MHDDDNMSYIEVGAWPEASFYDPARLGESAAFVATHGPKANRSAARMPSTR
jgi:hypothetical protein